jgi:ParB family chromosome partitioning protein
MDKLNNSELRVQYVPITSLKLAIYNPRKWNEVQIQGLKESISRFGLIDPLICNSAAGRENVVIGGHFRLKVAKDLGYESMPVVYVNIPELDFIAERNLLTLLIVET